MSTVLTVQHQLSTFTDQEACPKLPRTTSPGIVLGRLLSDMQRQRILEMAVGEESFAMHVDGASQFRNHAARTTLHNVSDEESSPGPRRPMGRSRAEPVQQPRLVLARAALRREPHMRVKTKKAKTCSATCLHTSVGPCCFLPLHIAGPLDSGSWMLNQLGN